MRDENEVCAEVAAMVERMDMFPEEFVGDSVLQKWDHIVYTMVGSLNSPLTEAEKKLVTNKLWEIGRERLKKDIIKGIVQADKIQDGDDLLIEEDPTPYIKPYNPNAQLDLFETMKTVEKF